MKHVQNHQKVSAIVKRFDEYVSDVREAMAEAGGFRTPVEPANRPESTLNFRNCFTK